MRSFTVNTFTSLETISATMSIRFPGDSVAGATGTTGFPSDGDVGFAIGIDTGAMSFAAQDGVGTVTIDALTPATGEFEVSFVGVGLSSAADPTVAIDCAVSGKIVNFGNVS